MCHVSCQAGHNCFQLRGQEHSCLGCNKADWCSNFPAGA
ncbi:hypothetical protein CsSME_00009319 [Camellia sinensis var. sinensis]